jgi:protein O-GlcNAc transferase
MTTNNVHPSQGQIDTLIAYYNSGRYDALVEQASLLAKEHPASPLVWNILAAGHHAAGRLDDAISAYRQAIDIEPAYADAFNNMGNAFKDKGQIADAISAYQRAIELNPRYAEAFFNMGIAFKSLGNLNDEISAYREAIAINPAFPEALNNMGNALKDQGQIDGAISAYRQAIEIKPLYLDAYHNLGVALNEKGLLDEAISAYQHVIEVNPAYASAHYNLGIAFKAMGNLEDAVLAYQRAIDAKQSYSDAYFNLGNTLQELGRNEEAIVAYQRALEIEPTYAEAYNNMGNRLKGLGQLDEAISAYRRALDMKPAYAEAYNNLANALKDQGKLDEAIEGYRKAIEIKPSYAAAEAHLIFELQQICDWNSLHQSGNDQKVLGITTSAVPPFALLAAEDCPNRQLERSIVHAHETFRIRPTPTKLKNSRRTKRIKVGYFSADFHNHATMYLMAGVFREQNRRRFDVHVYSYGPIKSSDMRDRLTSDVTKFFDIADLADQPAVELARSHSLDIAIDLKGYTQNTRSEIFQHRLAPIQINYLGYPGSMGVDFMDYIIADPVVIPEDQRAFYSEKVIYLPHSYQPNDDTRPIAKTKTSRADFGLPEDAFVFCCFNNNYKISPREYDIWMRILGKVNKSVLWLLRSNKWAEQNLRKEAEKRGVDANRIIFADRLPHAEHLARHKHADLFIDTFNYNAHTTASDALWAGLPVVTKIGKQFAARVAASLLTAIDLTELITENEVEYENLILDLAGSPRKLKNVRKKLEANRRTSPLFDTKRYARNFDTALMTAFENYRTEKQHNDIWVME